MKIDVNGTRLYYQVKGTGTPVILIHGNGEDHRIFDVLTEQLSARFCVYALDSRGHGQSRKTNIFDYQVMAEDVAAMITQLKLRRPVVYGFSDGGIIGLLLAIKYPQVLSKLIISGANTNPSGIKPLPYLLMKVNYFFTRSPLMRLMLTQPDITVKQLRTINVPVLVLAGSRDIIKEKHTRSMAAAIPLSRLIIVKGENHSSYIAGSPKLYQLIKPFIS